MTTQGPVLISTSSHITPTTPLLSVAWVTAHMRIQLRYSESTHAVPCFLTPVGLSSFVDFFMRQHTDADFKARTGSSHCP